MVVEIAAKNEKIERGFFIIQEWRETKKEIEEMEKVEREKKRWRWGDGNEPHISPEYFI